MGELCIRNHLFYTIGSDFHLNDGIHPQIGLINEQINNYKMDISWLKMK